MKTAATVAIAIASIMIGEARAADMAVPGGTPVVAPPVTYGNYAPTAYGNYNWSWHLCRCQWRLQPGTTGYFLRASMAFRRLRPSRRLGRRRSDWL